MSYKNMCASLLCSTLLMTSQVDAEEITDKVIVDSERKRPTFDTEVAGVPFIISTETLGTAIGVSGIIKHAGQPQASIFGLGLYSENDSNIGFISFNNYALPGLKQWLFSTEHDQYATEVEAGDNNQESATYNPFADLKSMFNK